MTDVRAKVERLLELHAKATPGEWRAMRAGNCRLLDGTLVGQSALRPVPRPYEPRWIGYSSEATALQWHHTTVLCDEDADFVAAAHNDLPTICAVYQELETAAGQMADVLDRFLDIFTGYQGMQWEDARTALAAFRSAQKAAST